MNTMHNQPGTSFWEMLENIAFYLQDQASQSQLHEHCCDSTVASCLAITKFWSHVSILKGKCIGCAKLIL